MHTRFRSIKQAISYCGLCGAERSSADNVVAHADFQAAQQAYSACAGRGGEDAPRLCHELALLHEKEMQKGNRNRATLAVARKLVCWMLAVERRKQGFVPADKFSGTAAA